MKLNDISIILNKTQFKEDSVIIKVLTKNHGIYSGIAKNNSKKKSSLPQKSDLVDFFWQARLSEHIGSCKVELIESNFSFIMLDKKKIYSVNAILYLINLSFQQRDPHPLLFNSLNNYLNNMANKKFSFLNHIAMEMNILSECGYGLDLTKCVKTGAKSDLIYVSPKSGKAVSKIAGEEYKNNLLKLPQFILTEEEPKNLNDIYEANLLIKYFIKRYISNNSDESNSRDAFYQLFDSENS